MNAWFRIWATCWGIILLLANHSAAQNPVDLDKTLLRDAKAQKYLQKGENLRALAQIRTLLETNPNDPGLNYYAGIILYHYGQPGKALPYLQYTFELKPRIDPNIQIYLGDCYHFNAEFEDAILAYQKALKRLSEGSRTYNQVMEKIARAKHAEELKSDPQPFALTNLGDKINSKFPEYGVRFNENGAMMFVSRTPLKKAKGYFKKNGGLFYAEDIGEQMLQSDGRDSIFKLTEPVSDEYLHKKTEWEYWFDGMDKRHSEELEEKGGDFLELTPEGAFRDKAKGIKGNSAVKYAEGTQVILPHNGGIIYSSGRPGGEGGWDLYIATMAEDGKWQKPKNLGPEINSSGNEITPWLSHDGKTLYFASNGPKSIGGFDIFKAKMLPDGSFSDAVHLGWPINSPADEISYAEPLRGEGFYLSSRRPGGMGHFDIYFGFKSEKAAIKRTIKGMVSDKSDGSALAATLLFKDLRTQNVDTLAYHPEDGPFEYRAQKGRQYKLTVQSKGFFGLSEVITVLPNGNLVNHSENIQLKRDPLQELILEGVVRDSVSGEPLLAYLDIVEAETNVLTGSIETDSETGLYRISVKPGVKYKILSVSPKHRTKLMYIETPEEPEYFIVEGDILMANALIGKKFVLKDIYFGEASSDLTRSSKGELDALAERMMSNLTMKIEIGGHTDNTGTTEDNLKLSQERADAVRAYLIEKGVAAFRLKARGYGDSQPIGDNSTESGRQMNRRTEFRILEY